MSKVNKELLEGAIANVRVDVCCFVSGVFGALLYVIW